MRKYTLFAVILAMFLCSSIAMATGTLLTSSIFDTLSNDSYMYTVSSGIGFSATLGSDPLDTTGTGGVARWNGAGYQYMQYNAASGLNITHVKVSWMAPADGGMTGVFTINDQYIESTRTLVSSDGYWNWYVSETNVKLSAVRVAFWGGDTWTPQAGTVEITVNDSSYIPVGNVIDHSIVDTLANESYWYSKDSNGINRPSCIGSTGSTAQREYNSGAQAWYSYKAATGKKLSHVNVNWSDWVEEPHSVTFQVKVAGNWVNWPMASSTNDGATTAWRVKSDTYSGFLADEVRLVIGASSYNAWWIPEINEVSLTVGDKPAISRGHQILMNRGLQLQAQCMPYALVPDYWNTQDWVDSNFTTINLHWDAGSGAASCGAPGTFMWGRWNGDSPEVTLADGEDAYVPYLTSVQFLDEIDLADSGRLAGMTAWYMNVHADPRFNNTLAFTNDIPSAHTDDQMRTYMSTCLPDMLMFDKYPFGNFAAFYQAMSKYRNLGLAGNDGTGELPIPYGTYLQTYTPLLGSGMGYIPSESEIRLNQFASWAFGCKFASALLFDGEGYDSLVGSIMFSGYGASRTRTPKFNEVAETNRQSRNLGSALVRLLSTDVRFVAGVNSSTDNGITPWSNTADQYMKTVSATNLGTENGGQPGDVLVGFFKPLVQAGTERYFMVVNGLAGGTAAGARQRIGLGFDMGTSGISSLQRLSRTTGLVEMISLVHDSGSLYHLDLTLDGGTGDLFKYNDGAAFVGAPANIANLADLGTASDGALVNVTVPVVATASSTTFSDGSYYVQSTDRSFGIKAIPAYTGTTVNPGNRLTFSGVVHIDANNQKYVEITAITGKTSEAPAEPLGIVNKATSGTGLAVSGLLVRVWGRVSLVNGGFAYIDDGSGVTDSLGKTGIRVALTGLSAPVTKNLANHFVAVTGLSGNARDGSTVVPVIRPRGDSDIDIIQ